jgi:uncharacterized protein
MTSNKTITLDSKDSNLIFNAKVEGRNVLNVIKQLVEKYKSTELLDILNRTLLISACFMGEYNAVKYLIEKGANINAQDKQGYSPLHAAAQERQVNIVKLLLLKGAKVNLLDDWGNSSLMRSIYNSDDGLATFKLLILAGADVYQKNKYGESVDSFLRGNPIENNFREIINTYISTKQ